MLDRARARASPLTALSPAPAVPVAIICPVSVTSLGKDPAALALSLGRWSVVVNISSALPSLGLPTTMCGLVTSSLVNSVSSRIVWTLRGHLTDGNPPLQCPSLTNPTDGDLASSQDFAPKSCTASGARPGAAPRDAVAAAALAAVAAVALAAGAAGARGA